MIQNLRPYPKYKDSGVPWLGDVPEHWEVRRIKTLFRETDERIGEGGGLLLSLTRARGIVPQAEASNRIAGVEDLSKYKVCKFGYLIMNRMQAWSGMFAVSGMEGVISPDYSVFQPTAAIEVHYFEALFKTPVLVDEFAKRSKGIGSGFNRLYTPDFGAVTVISPPLPEQTAIVRFLDWMERRLRRMIRARRRRIKLLEEYKQTLINQAVAGKIDVRTCLRRGFGRQAGNPYPKYKDSGVEWLGKVPEHWEVVHLARCLVRIDQGWSPIAAEGELAVDQWAVLTLSAVRKGEFDPTAIKPIPVNASIRSGIEISDGDLLITRSNTRDLVGDVCIVRGVRPKTVLCDLIYRLVTRKDLVNAKFLMYLFLSRVGREQIERDARGSSGTMPKISQQRMRTWLLTLPPLAEQTAIVEFLEEQTGKIDAAIFVTRREIDLLKEFRTRLIADVVTGKVDVRDAAAKLSDLPASRGQADEPTEEEAETVEVAGTDECNEMLDKTGLDFSG